MNAADIQFWLAWASVTAPTLAAYLLLLAAKLARTRHRNPSRPGSFR